MQETASDVGGRILGREAELAALEAFAGADGPVRALVLVGEPGIGKTTLWEAAVALARERGRRVLSARGSGAETRLSSAALVDLLDGVGRGELGTLPPPQLQALEIALFRAEPAGVSPEPHAIALGVLNALRSLGATEPLVVAIDDLQWLDPVSADALAFAARRLGDESISFLLARRPGPAPALEQALGERRIERVEVRALSVGATRRVLAEHLGLGLRRHLLRRIFETTLGNPLFVVEVGRALAAGGLPEPGGDLPVPETVEDLLGTRVAQLPPPVRTLLLALALDADLRAPTLEAIAGPGALDDAVDEGLLLLDGERARPSHPLLAAAARTRSRARERRELHRTLAGLAGDTESHALHLALATTVPDDELAATIAAAAARTSARGAAQHAVVLGEHALRLTPAASPQRNERLLELAGYLEVAGERRRVTDLLTPELGSLHGRERIRAWLRLAEGGAIRGMQDTIEYLERALAASEDDGVMRAYVLAKKSHLTPAYVRQIPQAEAWALEALSASGGDPVLERLALHGLGWARAMRGLPIDDVCRRFRTASDAATHITESPEPVEGLRLLWRGQVEEARPILTSFLELADARGEEVSYALQRMQVCELELRAGRPDAAARLLDEWESADRQLLIRATYERFRAQLAACRGFPEEASRWAGSSLAGAEPGDYRWQMLEAQRVRGLAALLAGEPARAAESLRAVWKHMREEGVDDPGVFPVAPDLVEALVELGELDEARDVVERLRRLSEEQDHPWGRASSRRCAALVGLASGADDAPGLAAAAAEYGGLGLPFDRARTLLALGRAQRRMRKWGAARAALEQAAALFGELGAPGWAEQARAELERVGGRRPRSEADLTPTERRVAELAADGLANKEIARALFMSVRTVEVHLKNAYRKLGIRSRTQLARRLSQPS